MILTGDRNIGNQPANTAGSRCTDIKGTNAIASYWR